MGILMPLVIGEGCSPEITMCGSGWQVSPTAGNRRTCHVSVRPSLVRMVKTMVMCVCVSVAS